MEKVTCTILVTPLFKAGLVLLFLCTRLAEAANATGEFMAWMTMVDEVQKKTSWRQ